MTSLIQDAMEALWFTEWTLCVYKYPLLVFGLEADFAVRLDSKYKRTENLDDAGLEEIVIRLVVSFPNDIIPLAQGEAIAVSAHEAFICTKDIFEADKPAHIVLGMTLNVFIHETTTKLMARAGQIADMAIQADDLTNPPTDEDLN